MVLPSEKETFVAVGPSGGVKSANIRAASLVRVVCVCVCGIVLFFLGWCWFLGGVGSSWGGGVRVGNCRRGG